MYYKYGKVELFVNTFSNIVYKNESEKQKHHYSCYNGLSFCKSSSHFSYDNKRKLFAKYR